MLGPGIVRHAGAGQSYLAESVMGTQVVDKSRAARLKEVANLFNEAGFETQLVKNADSLIWGKLAVNAGINPLTALLQVPNGFLLENDDARWLMSRAAAEVSAVAQALEIPLPYADAAKRAAQVAQATAANYSSMAQDTARGVPTEIEAICGAVVQYGRRFGLPTPVNLTLQELIQRQATTGQWHDSIPDQPPDIRQRLARLAARN
jgi:2-dehydropantoate 2-reductase